MVALIATGAGGLPRQNPLISTRTDGTRSS